MIGAGELAALLGQPPPTDEQRAVIEAPLSPALVVAGAGSGKTETMANRVIWLLANRQVRVGEVLGLTFTRKAAGELAKRIAERVGQLEAAGLLPFQEDTLEQATVSTYNAFASEIFQNNALLVGREPESVLLSESSSWLLARRVVVNSRDERLVRLGHSIEKITDTVLELSHELSENVADAAAVAGLAERFGYLTGIPYTDGRRKKDPYKDVATAVDNVSALPVLLELAQQYGDE
ncbi:MAG: UvrD-helicase domain-containing protein, partial [Microbacteriaceae bacterium]